MSTNGSEAIDITIAHSPDSDDAFMFYGLATKKVRTPVFEIPPYFFRYRNPEPESTGRSVYDLTAISFHAYPYIRQICPDGPRRSVGDGYGPMVVAVNANPTMEPEEIKGKKIANSGHNDNSRLSRVEDIRDRL